MLPSKAHAYDLTIYKTADNSVMGVKEDKLGLDMTGYMFLGEGTKEGLYFRIGIQTPSLDISLFLKRDSQQKKTQIAETNWRMKLFKRQ